MWWNGSQNSYHKSLSCMFVVKGETNSFCETVHFHAKNMADSKFFIVNFHKLNQSLLEFLYCILVFSDTNNLENKTCQLYYKQITNASWTNWTRLPEKTFSTLCHMLLKIISRFSSFAITRIRNVITYFCHNDLSTNQSY